MNEEPIPEYEPETKLEVKKETKPLFTVVNGINVLREALEEEITMLLSFHKNYHLRDVCRIFTDKIGIKPTDTNQALMLDVGCRNLEIAPFMKNLGYAYTGLDKKPQTNSIVVGEMENIPFLSDSFSVVFCCHTFEHSENPLKTLREFARVSKANGVIFMATPIQCQYQLFECDKTHIFCPTPMQMKRMLEHVGIIPLCVELWNVEGQEDRFASLITIGRVVK